MAPRPQRVLDDGSEDDVVGSDITSDSNDVDVLGGL